ncbi:ABC transporter ATP-binding protein [Candidatus Spongiihabitans sp.]|uniref:ABC transporter ATP-binding protein n=1 Tax=Candidatus Spongiihabitans sp. TaxID=3101308 RepID=UPI003C70068F
MPLLSVKNLEVVFPLRTGSVTAIKDVSFDLEQGERIGIVGESGAGKSISAFAILNLISKPGYLAAGSILFKDRDLANLDEEQMRQIRGNEISMIFQDPMMTLNPVLTIGTQMEETILAHKNLSRQAARKISVAKLKAVQIPSAETRLEQYPHELSGGMRQRVVIAIALLSDPAIIIADEPTTALDVTIQAEILELLLNLCNDFDVGLILITHDLGVVSEVTQRILVMYAGRIIEQGPTDQVIAKPMHPYTQGLLGALPEKARPGQRLNQIPGVMPSLQEIPAGCPFHNRCNHAQAVCKVDLPVLGGNGSRAVACHFPLNQ